MAPIEPVRFIPHASPTALLPQATDAWPRTVAEAVELKLRTMSDGEKANIRAMPRERPPPLEQAPDMRGRPGQIFHPEWIATSPPMIGSTLVRSNPASRIIRSNSGIGGKRRIDSIR